MFLHMAVDLGDTPQHENALETGPALRIMQATVDSLLDGAPPELATELRQELPDPLKGATRPYNEEAPATVAEFLDRFKQRTGLPDEGLLHEAQIAVGMVEEMLSGEGVTDLRASFPAEFSVLFERPSRH